MYGNTLNRYSAYAYFRIYESLRIYIMWYHVIHPIGYGKQITTISLLRVGLIEIYSDLWKLKHNPVGSPYMLSWLIAHERQVHVLPAQVTLCAVVLSMPESNPSDLYLPYCSFFSEMAIILACVVYSVAD